MTLGAALGNLEIEFIDGVMGNTVPDKAVPLTPELDRPPDPVVGSWRAHMNAIQELVAIYPGSGETNKLMLLHRVVRRNLTTALILEDDADWDIRIRDQLRDFALSAHALTQPLASDPRHYADPTYPSPNEDSPVAAEISYKGLPETVAPMRSPYGDNWNVLWVGHCGMKFPFADNMVAPRGRVVWHDESVPQQQYLKTFTKPDELKEQYPNHTRVVHHAQEAVCSIGYAITQKAARQLLYEVGLKELSAAFDIQLRWFCEGGGGRKYHKCLTSQPSLFHHHRPLGPKSAESDISDHGEGWQEKAHTRVVRWSVRMNAEILMEGGTDFIDQYPDVD
jgi:hypothetical protein